MAFEFSLPELLWCKCSKLSSIGHQTLLSGSFVLVFVNAGSYKETFVFAGSIHFAGMRQRPVKFKVYFQVFPFKWLQRQAYIWFAVTFAFLFWCVWGEFSIIWPTSLLKSKSLNMRWSTVLLVFRHPHPRSYCWVHTFRHPVLRLLNSSVLWFNCS